MSEGDSTHAPGSGAITAPRTPRDGRWRPDKLTTLSAAIAACVKDGALLALGGMALYRSPVAAAAEIIRQGFRDLSLLDYVAGFEGDILVGAGCVSCVRSCYFGLDVVGLAPMYRAAVEQRRVKVIEETEVTVAYGLRAARAGIDFMPARTFSGTDMLSVRPDLALVPSPYSDDLYVAIPALLPDVAIVHAWCADRAGNAVLRSEYCLDVDLAAAARVTIVTAEHIVSTHEVEAHGADIIAAHVEHVVAAPRGAWPSSCYPDYRADLSLLMDYADACRDQGFAAFLRDFLSRTTPP